ncbi:MAG: DUF1311 domain-containing protein [Burkholderiales bacterium]|nr:DUF1311 domain-containing protein [Burkholderiales bacterium]
MMNASTRRAFVIGATGLAVMAAAHGTSFDCSKAKGEVETLVCSDASLAALDQRLDTVYQAAVAKAKGKLANQLRAEQRGWIKGRNDCWKAKGQPTWITATWTVDTVRGCVEAQTRLRTSRLQAVWRLLPPRTVTYACQGNPANEVVANFFVTDPATIQLERGDRTKTLWQIGRPDAGSYEGQNVNLVHQGSTIRLNWLDTDTGKTDELDCKAR